MGTTSGPAPHRRTSIPIAFIGGPFRGPTAWDVAENVRHAERYGLMVARIGAMPLIPHANTHLFYGQLSEEDFWLPGYRRLVELSDCMVLVPGWETSSGTRSERERLVALGRGELIFDLGVQGLEDNATRTLGYMQLAAFVRAFRG